MFAKYLSDTCRHLHVSIHRKPSGRLGAGTSGDSQELELSSEEIHIPIPVFSFGAIAIDLKELF